LPAHWSRQPVQRTGYGFADRWQFALQFVLNDLCGVAIGVNAVPMAAGKRKLTRIGGWKTRIEERHFLEEQ
jgi:hypothetical protein